MIANVYELLFVALVLPSDALASDHPSDDYLNALEKTVIELDAKTMEARPACDVFRLRIQKLRSESNQQNPPDKGKGIDELLSDLKTYPGDSSALKAALNHWREYQSKRAILPQTIKGPFQCYPLELYFVIDLYSTWKQKGFTSSAQDNVFKSAAQEKLLNFFEKNDTAVVTLVVSAAMLRMIEAKLLNVPDALLHEISKLNLELENSIASNRKLERDGKLDLNSQENRNLLHRQSLFPRQKLQNCLSQIWP